MRRGELLDFYHGQLRQVVEETYLAEGLRRAAHQDLASYFSNQGYGSWRTLSELPYHLTHGQRWESLGRVLCSLEFIQAKCSASLTPELIADYRLALQAPGLPEAEYRALSDFSRFVSARPRTRAAPRPDVPAGDQRAGFDGAGPGGAAGSGRPAGQAILPPLGQQAPRSLCLRADARRGFRRPGPLLCPLPRRPADCHGDRRGREGLGRRQRGGTGRLPAMRLRRGVLPRRPEPDCCQRRVRDLGCADVGGTGPAARREEHRVHLLLFPRQSAGRHRLPR